ncbi:MAG: hypothetical protein R2710_05965 [Acidimicrobiales bacterium]
MSARTKGRCGLPAIWVGDDSTPNHATSSPRRSASRPSPHPTSSTGPRSSGAIEWWTSLGASHDAQRPGSAS